MYRDACALSRKLRAAVSVLAALLLASFLLLSQSALAATYTVNYAGDESDDNLGDGVCDIGVGGYCTLRAAVAEANQTYDEDIIEIQAGVGPIQLIVNSPFSIQRPMVIRGLGEQRTIIEPSINYDDNSLIRAGGWSLTLENIEVRGHKTPGGAAIWGTRTPFAMDNCWIHDNLGDGILLEWQRNDFLALDVTIRDSIITGNGSDGLVILGVDDLPFPSHGLIERTIISDNGHTGLRLTDARVFFTPLQLVIRNSTFSGNQDTGIDLGAGAVTTIRNSLIANNSTTDVRGGGGLRTDSLTWLIDSFVTNNSAVRPEGGGGGGGIRTEYPMAIYGSTISGNRADVGGGLDARDGLVQVVNSTISGNQATANGGGVFSQANLNVQCSTIAFNRADSDGNDNGDGGGIFASSGQVGLHSSILGENTTARTTGGLIPFPISPDCTFIGNASILSYGYNMISNTRDCSVSWQTTDRRGVGDQHGLQPLANNGGPTLTHALAPPTFALDEGDPAGCTWDHDQDDGTAPVQVVGDQRGYTRPEDGGSGEALPDKGAFELNGEMPDDIFEDGFEN